MTVSLTAFGDPDLPVSFSRYELLEVIGKGGMGRVFRATLKGPAGFRKEVALKMILDREGTVLTRQRDQLAREARLGGMLRHPNIVDTYELGEFQGEMFIAMEYIQGLPLSTLLFREKGLPPAAALDVLLQVAAALDHAHSLRIEGQATPLVHRDLKPSNILVDRTGLAKVTDFGVSILRRSDQMQEEAVSGTLRYMSPEQITGGLVGPQSDLFAFGVVAYELFAGARLFPKGEPQEVAQSILTAARAATQSRQLQRIAQDLPGIVELIVHCLQLQISDRIGSARQIFEKLRSLRAAAPGESLLQVLSRHLSEVHLLHAPSIGLSSNESLDGDRPAQELPDLPQARAKHNLPENLPVLHGRGPLLKELERQIKKKGRIVTLKGPGGVGKSAAALHYLHQAAQRFPDGRWVFDFSDIREGSAALQRIAQEYNLPLRPEDTQGNIEQIGRFLATQEQCILLFDSSDRVLSFLKKTITTWLEIAPNLVFLVTSRSRLKLDGERLIEVKPLDGSHALSLFMDIAKRVRTASPVDPLVAAQIVNRLEGNPLSVSLAAGRLADLEPRVLLQRVTESFSTLSTIEETTSRQATLQATIAWSWNLMEPAEAEALAHLSVFRGSFTVDAAEAILDLSSYPHAPPATELLQRLIDRSLVQALSRMDRPRFSLSKSIREYASQKLGGMRPALEQRFVHHFKRLGEPHHRTLLKGGGVEGREIIRDFENITHALDLALERRTSDAMLCFQALVGILERTGPFTRVLDIANKMSQLQLNDHQQAVIDLKRSDALIVAGDLDQASTLAEQAHQVGGSLQNPELISEALYLLAMIHIQRGEPRFVVDHAESAIGMARQSLNNVLVARWIALRGRAHRLQGSYEDSLQDFKTAAQIARQIGDQSQLANSLGSQGIIESLRGNLRVAVQLVGQSVAVAHNSGDRRLHASRLFLLGTILLDAGELDEALEDYRRARIQYQELNEGFNEAMVLVGLSQVHYLKDHCIEARALLFESLKLLEAFGAEAHSGIVYINFAEIETEMGLLDEAEHHLNEGLKVSEKTGSFRVKAGIQQATGKLYLRQGRLKEAKVLLDTALEAYRSSQEMTELGKTYCCISEYHHLLQERELALTALQEAKAIARSTGTSPHSELGKRISWMQDRL